MFQKMCKITQHNDNYVVVNIINILFAYLLLIGNKNLFIITKVVDKKKGFINQSIQKKGLLIESYLILTHVILFYLLPMPLILERFQQLH